jgi:S1-C subfamily serine protease
MTRIYVYAACVSGFALGFWGAATRADGQQVTGLQAAAAMEEVFIKAIAQSERSVVAIARVKRNSDDHQDEAPSLFNRLGRAAPRPGDAEFIPNEYATGVVVGAEGLILTAHHVLREDSDYWVTTADRKTYKVNKIMGADPRSDLAVLSIEAEGLVPIKFGDASKLKKGQIVIALGNPYAIARDGQVSASWGIISNLARKDGPWPGREGQPTKPTMHQYGTLIQTDAKLNLGTSGGALLNLKGEMIGLTVSLAAALGYEQSAGFALPVDETFLRAVKTLKQGSEVEYGFLGISLPPPYDTRSRGKVGVMVVDVLEGTPAERSLLQKDDFITHVNGQEIHDHDELLLNVGKLPPDASVRLSVERDGRSHAITIGELSKYPVTGNKVVTSRPPAWRGIRVDYVTASNNFATWANQRRLDPQGAVLVTEVQEYSPAWKEGLRPDMMISHVGNKRVATPKDFLDAVANQEGPVKLRLTLPPSERPVRTIEPDAS